MEDDEASIYSELSGSSSSPDKIAFFAHISIKQSSFIWLLASHKSLPYETYCFSSLLA
jgi:hypothetical protein